MVLSEISQRFEEFDRQVSWSSKRETYPAQQRGNAEVSGRANNNEVGILRRKKTERERFELSIRFPVCSLSRTVP